MCTSQYRVTLAESSQLDQLEGWGLGGSSGFKIILLTSSKNNGAK